MSRLSGVSAVSSPSFFLPRALAALMLAALPALAAAQTAQLAPPAERISDEAIQRDHGTYDAMQGRIKALNDRGVPVRDYALAKAQCWLDVSFHEYTRNDRSPFPQGALGESERLVVALETRATPPTDTPLVNGAARLRPDLWAAADALKGMRGWRCAQQKAACAEVELVHAGNEFNQQQWRHAKPYIQIAEDLLGEAAVLAERCDPPTAGVRPAAPLPVPAVPAAQRQSFVTSVVFDFDRSAPANIRPFSLVQLDDALARVRREGLVVQAVRLVGHADRLNGTGNAAYNQRLSERRVATVRDRLVGKGIDAALIRSEARGDSQPIEGCEGRFPSQAALTECLLPNRRVEVVLETTAR